MGICYVCGGQTTHSTMLTLIRTDTRDESHVIIPTCPEHEAEVIPYMEAQRAMRALA